MTHQIFAINAVKKLIEIEARADREAKDIAKKYDRQKIIDLKLLIKLTKENRLDDVIKLINLDNFNVNIQNEFGITPLMWFCGNGNFEIVKLLLEKGADIDLKDDWGNKAYVYIINGKSKLIDLLENYKK